MEKGSFYQKIRCARQNQQNTCVPTWWNLLGAVQICFYLERLESSIKHWYCIFECGQLSIQIKILFSFLCYCWFYCWWKKTCFHIEFDSRLYEREIGIKLNPERWKGVFCFCAVWTINSFHIRSPGGRVFHQVKSIFFRLPPIFY